MSKRSGIEPIRLTARVSAVSTAVAAALAGVSIGSAQTKDQQAAVEAINAARAQLLQKLSPAQAAMVKPLLQRGLPTPGGEIRGFVTAALREGLGLGDTALPNAQVFVQTPDGRIDQQTLTQTNGQGRFHIPLRPPGTYTVCAALKGFANGCRSVTIVNQNVSLPQAIEITPLGATIRGCAKLRDGTPAVRSAVVSYATAGAAEVSAENGAGQVVGGPVPVNASGCYVLPDLRATAGLTVVARYEQAAARLTVPPGALDIQARPAVNVALPRRRLRFAPSLPP